MADFIADNLFIIIIILGAIFSFLKKPGTNDNKHKKSENSSTDHSTSRSYSSGTRSVNDDLIPTYSSGSPISSASDRESIEQQKAQQMKELEKRVGARTASDSADKMRTSSTEAITGQGENIDKSDSSNLLPSTHSGNAKTYQKDFRKEIKGRLDRKELIDSIVMAEVLGPPRAKKPYSSIINKKQ